MAQRESKSTGQSDASDSNVRQGAVAIVKAPRDTDEQLVQRTLGGDTGAFDQLVERYQDRIYNLLARMCVAPDQAEDLAQDTFLQAFRALRSFKQGAKFYTWLFRIALNNGFSKRRQDVRRKLHEGARLDAVAAGADEQGQTLSALLPERHSSDPSQQLDRQCAAQRVREELGRIDPDYRTILLLREIDGMDYDGIAETLSISRAAVKSRLHRARLEMARLLKDLRK